MSKIKSKYLSENMQGDDVYLVSYPKSYNNSSITDYVTCYDRSLELLLEPILEKGKSDAPDDMVLIPSLYLCRHIIELELKRLLYILSSRFDERYKTSNKHSLGNLYEECVKYFKDEDYLKEDTQVFRAFSKLIDFFSRFDKSGITFRYPSDLEMKIHTFNEGQKYVNISSLYEDYKKLISFTGYIDHKLDEIFGNSIA